MSNGLLTGIDPRPTEHWAGVVIIDHILPVCTLARFEPVKPNCLVFNKPRLYLYHRDINKTRIPINHR